MPKSRPQLLAHLFECLSLQQRWADGDPPKPKHTTATLQKGIQALVAELKVSLRCISNRTFPQTAARRRLADTLDRLDLL